jgi:beta-lactamase class D
VGAGLGTGDARDNKPGGGAAVIGVLSSADPAEDIRDKLEDTNMALKMAAKSILSVLLIVMTMWGTPALSQDDIAGVFPKNGIKGTMLISRLDGKKEFAHNEKRIEERFPSASTFKIFNSLIALDTGVIKSLDQVIKWDGHFHTGFPDWNRDHTLTSAYKASCVWCFQQLARKVGATRYEQQLSDAVYGHLRKPFVVDQFWLDGSLSISAREQVEFLRKLVNRSLPYKASAYDKLRTVMLMEDAPDYRVRAKTGWATRSDPQIGWYVGYVETPADTWLFTLNIDIHDKSELPKRQELTMASLKATGILK